MKNNLIPALFKLPQVLTIKDTRFAPDLHKICSSMVSIPAYAPHITLFRTHESLWKVDKTSLKLLSWNKETQFP